MVFASYLYLINLGLELRANTAYSKETKLKEPFVSREVTTAFFDRHLSLLGYINIQTVG